MSALRHFRCIAVAAAIGIAGASLALPAFADTSTQVAFQNHNPWTQEVGSVTHYENSHDYTVAIEAGKTLQINLVTRDPNLFFTVTNDTLGKKLIDTYNTGATTWSTQNATAATYTIHVYIQPAAVQLDEKVDYALQIGQYGLADMRVPATTISFEDHKPWVQEAGTLDSSSTARDYTVAIAAGQTLAVNLITHNPKVHFKVQQQPGGNTLIDSASSNATTWSTPVATATSYTISVYADPAALPPGSRAGYVLQVGQYAQSSAPAAAGSAATPAAAGTTSH